MHKYRDLARRLRHDLLKHLDIPRPSQVLTEAEAQVLRHRLYARPSGSLESGLRILDEVLSLWPKDPELEQHSQSLKTALQDLASVREELDERCRNARPIGAQISHCLQRLERLVQDFDAFAEKKTQGQDEAFSLLDDLSLIDSALLPSPASKREPERKSNPKHPLKGTENQKIRILVIDDRLLAIKRLQSRLGFLQRFDWVRLQASLTQRSPEEVSDPDSLCRARNYEEAAQCLLHESAAGQRIDIILLDLRFDELQAGEVLWLPDLPELNQLDSVKALQGLLIARALKKIDQATEIPLLLMTARSQLPSGSEQLLAGLEGLQFLGDDDSLDVLMAKIEGLVKRVHVLTEEQHFFWGKSPRMQAIRRQVELMSQGPRTVFITGPSGSGKTYLVSEVIFPSSRREELVTLDLSSVPDSLVESELFGHVKGAFSGAVSDRRGLVEEAERGILFLDEIGNLSLENQRKLLLFLQDKMLRRVGAAHKTRRRVDVKVVAATHLDLAQEVAAGRFRFDLYMRLGPAMQICLPQLSERKEDLPSFIDQIVQKLAHSDDMRPYLLEHAERTQSAAEVRVDFHKSSTRAKGLVIRFTSATRELFQNYPWPGNSRELESVLDTLVLKAFYDQKLSHNPSRVIEIDHYYALTLLGDKDRSDSSKAPKRLDHKNFPRLDVVDDFPSLRQKLESAYLSAIFQDSQGDLGEMARILFGQDSSQWRHKIAVRMNQLGLKVRLLKQKL